MFNIRNGNNLEISDTMIEGVYNSMNFNIGLDTALNNKKPIDFNASHPLSSAQGMYWGMLKYRFIVMEGIIYDELGKELNSISYHTGIDLSKTVTKNSSFEVKENSIVKFQVKFDLSKVFTATGNNINPETEVFTHSSPGTEYNIAKKVTDNLAIGTTIN